MSSSLTLYTQSAELVRDFLTAKGSLKNLCYAPHIENKKAVIALVHQTLKFKSALVTILCMAQVPGFRYHDLKRYERILYENSHDIAPSTTGKSDTEDAKEDELDSDEEYERDILRWKKARTAAFHNRKNGDATADDSLVDHDAEDDNLGITDSWHSCMVNVSVPIHKQNVPHAKAAAEDEFVDYSSGKSKNKKNFKKRKTPEHSSGKTFRARYMREVMLVLAYDLLFGKGLVRMEGAREHAQANGGDRAGVLSAMKVLTAKTCPLYVGDEEMRRLGDAEDIEKLYGVRSDGQRVGAITTVANATTAGVGSNSLSNAAAALAKGAAPARATAQPKWATTKSSITLDGLFGKPPANTGGLWATSSTPAAKPSLWATSAPAPAASLWATSKPTTAITTANNAAATAASATATTHMDNQIAKTTSTVASTETPTAQGVQFSSLGFPPPREWTLRQRLKAAVNVLKGRMGIINAATSLHERMASAKEDSKDSSDGAAKSKKVEKAAEDELLLPPSLRDHYGRKFPRYVRINTLLIEPNAALEQLQELGYILVNEVPVAFRNTRQKCRDGSSVDTEIAAHKAMRGVRRSDEDTRGGELDVEYTRLRLHGSGTVPIKRAPIRPAPVTPVTSSTGATATTGKTASAATAAAEPRIFWIDPFVPNLLCFLPTDLSILACPMVAEQRTLIVQDKASCLPPLALLPPPGATVIDGCSAPGNKTSLLSALMNGQGKLYAIELNARRARSMDERLKESGAANVEVVNTSFFSIDPKDPKYAKTEYILLDPSCSGSGNPSLDVLLANDGRMHAADSNHVRSLADLQTALVKHAFTFPHLKSLVFSTCSIYNRENEAVVYRVTQAAQEAGFELVPCLSRWPCRGFNHILKSDLEGATGEKVSVRAEDVDGERVRVPNGNYTARIFADEYHTGGFYVACFRKKGSDYSLEKQTLQQTLEWYGFADAEVVKDIENKEVERAEDIGKKVGETAGKESTRKKMVVKSKKTVTSK